MYRNVAAKFALFAFDATTGLGKSGDAANLTAYVSKDYGTVTVLADTSATEMDATNAKGWYLFDAAQAETDAVTLLVTGKSSTANISVVGRVIETTANNSSLHSIDSNGRVDVIKIAGTTQTARDIGASVLLSSGTGTGQLDFTSGVVKANAVQLLGTAWLTPGTAGTPDVNVKLWNALSTVALPLVPTTAGRTLDVSAGGEAGVDWANVGSPTTSLNLSGTTIATTQKVDVETIKTNPVVNAGTITFPTTATLASTTNITAGTITTATNVTNDVGITQAGADKVWGTATRALTDKAGFALSSAGVQAIWDALTSALTTVGSIGKLLVDRIDATITSRMATFVYTAPPTAADNADAVWDELLSGHAVSGSAGEALTNATAPTAAAVADAVWDEAIAGHVGAGSTGEALTNAGAAGTPPTAVAIANEVQTRTIAGVTLVATTTNLTNAPTNGDLTATMKTSVTTAATAATPTVTAGTVTDKTGYALTSGERTSIAAAVWGSVMEGSRTAIQYMRGFGAVLLSKASGMGTTTGTFRDVDDTKDRVVATQDADGNRTAITLDLT